MKTIVFVLGGGLLLTTCGPLMAQPINRQAVVERHKVHVTNTDSLGSLSVGNGKFAFTTDFTGLQTFPQHY